jgi:hypothetical protein
MRFSYCRLCLIALLVAALAGCGGGGGTPAGTRITALTIEPAGAIVRPNGTRAFTFRVEGTGTPDNSVVWRADSGTVDSNGVYVANGGAPIAHVTVQSVSDPTKSATAVVTVSDTAGPTFIVDTATKSTLSQHFFTIDPGASIDLSALVRVTGAANTGILWTVVTAGGGTIDPSGRYTAPGTNGTYLIRIAAAADPAQIDHFYAVVGPIASLPVTGAISIKIPVGANGAPLAVLKAGSTYRFGYALTIQNSTNTSVTWSVNNGATIGADGSFTPPSPGTYTVTVTSVGSGQSASATVVVQ